jgi:hypothetical protein
MADFRDYVMFNRIVEGISKKQQDTQEPRFRQMNDMSLAHIVGARNASETDLKDKLKPSSRPPSMMYFPMNAQPSLQSLVEHSFSECNGDDGVFSMDF